MWAVDKEVKKVGAIPDGDEPGKLRIRICEKVPVAFRGQVLTLGLYGNRGNILLCTHPRRIVGEFALEADDQTRNCFCICRRTCSEFHLRPNETEISHRRISWQDCWRSFHQGPLA